MGVRVTAVCSARNAALVSQLGAGPAHPGQNLEANRTFLKLPHIRLYSTFPCEVDLRNYRIAFKLPPGWKTGLIRVTAVCSARNAALVSQLGAGLQTTFRQIAPFLSPLLYDCTGFPVRADSKSHRFAFNLPPGWKTGLIRVMAACSTRRSRDYRGTSLIRNRRPPGPCSSPMRRALRWSCGGGAVSYERGNPAGLMIQG